MKNSFLQVKDEKIQRFFYLNCVILHEEQKRNDIE
jgi:hypothetical protein